MDKRSIIILPLLSGVLLYLSFPPVDFGALSFFALIPLLISLNRIKRSSFIQGYLTGLTFFFCLLFWTKAYHPLALPLIVLIPSLYFGLFSYLYSLLTTHYSLLTILAAPFLWTSLEFIRSLGTFGFPWGAIGYTQYKNLPFIQLSSITGVFGVSFLIVLINSILAQIVLEWRREKRERRILKRLIFSCVLIIVIWYGGGLWVISKSSIPERDLMVAIIQGGFSSSDLLDWTGNRDRILQRLEDLTKKAGKFHPRLIIWPETSVREPIERSWKLMDWLERLSESTNAFLLVGSYHIDDKGRCYNSAFLFSPSKGLVNRYDKIHLVPFGEFLPFERLLSFARHIAPEIGDFTPGEKHTIFQLPAKFGVIICFEDIFSDLTRRFVKRGASFLVNITNDVWSESRASHYQHFNMCVFRAVENGCFLVRAGNTGISAIINPRGKIEKILPFFREDILIGDISLDPTPTFYTRYGDVFPYFSLCLSLISIIYIFLRKGLKKIDKQIRGNI